MILLTDLFEVGKWAAAVFLSVGYWIQVYKIHVHKEVRDLSAVSYVLFAIAYCMLGLEAYKINSMMFLVKNILVLIPTLVIIYQIHIHKDDKWE